MGDHHGHGPLPEASVPKTRPRSRRPTSPWPRYLGRDVTIVLGAQDTDRTARLLEVSPPAMAQGANRVECGLWVAATLH